MEFFLAEMLPANSVVFRGNLTMPKGASVADHIETRAAFLREIKRRCPSMRIRWTLHITGHKGELTQAHCEFTAYCHESESDQARTAVRESWKASGGKRASVKSLSDPDFTAWSKYSSKDTVAGDEWRHVPSHNGLDVTGGSQGFWGKGITLKILDDRIRRATRAAQFTAELLPEPTDQWAESMGEVSNTVIALKCQDSPPQTDSETPSVDQSWRELAGDSKRVIYTEGSRFEQRLSDLQRRFPDRLTITENKGTYTPLDREGLIAVAIRGGLREASDPIGVAELSERIGLQPTVISEALESMPDVRRIDFELTRDGTFRTDMITL